MRSVREIQRFWREGVVVELVEIAFVGELFLRPDSTEAFDEFSAATVVLGLAGEKMGEG